jgi:predicted DNA-binding transcriptional regulator AlpA
MSTRYVSVAQLAARYNVDKATIWRWSRKGTLPAPIKLSDQCTRWNLDEVERRDAQRAASAA